MREIHNRKSDELQNFKSDNGGVCIVSEKDGTFSGQIKDRTAKLPTLKYERPLACTNRDISNFKVSTVEPVGSDPNPSRSGFRFRDFY